MKTRVISAIGSLVLGAFAVGGCSAENSGSQIGEDTDIGVSQHAVVGGVSPIARTFPASCVINDNGTDKLLVIGGYDATGDGKNEVYLYTPATDTWTQKESLPGSGIGEAEAMAIPSDDKCIVIGGRQSIGGTVVNSTYVFDLSDNTDGLNNGEWTTKATLNTGRVNFGISRCGTNTGATTKVIAVGGLNNSNAVFSNNSIEVYDLNANTWTAFDTNGGAAGTPALVTPRAYLALATANTTYDKFLITGGEDPSSAAFSDAELLMTNSAAGACTFGRIDSVASMLASARSMPVAFRTTYSAMGNGSGKFYVVGGTSDRSNALATSDEINVSWGVIGGAATTATTTPGSSLQTARRRPVLVPMDTTLKNWAVIGGIAANETSVGKLEVWDGTTSNRWENLAGTAATEDTLSDARYGFAAGYLGASKLTVSLGAKVVYGGPLAVLDSTEEL